MEPIPPTDGDAQPAADGKDGCSIPTIPVCTALGHMTLLLPHLGVESISTPLEPAWPYD